MDPLRPQHPGLSRRTARVAAALLAAGAALLAPGVASACRCPAAPSDATAYRQAWAVVLAEVVQVQGDPYGPGGATVVLNSAAAWKRDLPRRLTVQTETTCAFEMYDGEQVLLYLRHAGDDPLANFSTRQCLGNQRGAAAEAASQRLQRNRKAAQLRP